ncbi:DUF975 family protein [Paraclostridium sordellii]|uniref:DUF975 family protein n=1 Tax=Paraclostridium sordellii TaxID=1505 RepID=UPI000386113D|nr:DUF975 family protein [Paeniclostridium sordellii]EPZ59759.1 hypothetical protein H476_0900 [[Clostridium] sordellii VPI 9048] [Paeniclostridium sordellii VPI 9048]MDU2148532.1 DUF975 family protein [Paeniclostridium sordellii]CEK38950.1 putative membrane protein, DUF975 family [[Clostridium] sordellii] [Paeniclostridium sordellii]
MKELSKSQLKGNWTTPVLVSLVYSVITILISMIQSETNSNFIIIISLLATFLIGVWATIGIPSFYLRFVETSGSATFRDLIVDKSSFFKSFLYTLILSLISFVIAFITIFFLISIGTGMLLSNGSLSTYAFIVIAVVSLVILLTEILILAISQTPYLILENPSMGVFEAIKLSMNIMKGNKCKLFILELSFIGWAILALLTFGIGFFWLEPYIMLTKANFYKLISRK